MDASKEILEVVERVKKDAEQAEKAFDTQNDELTRKSSRSIDLFGGSASSQVVEIASMAREACDSLYASLQTLVKITDEECRPLLAQGADTQAVKEALELIKWLNSESAVGANFTGSLNGANLGDIVSAKYVPTMESKMIQAYWESKYASMPGTAEADKAYLKKQNDEYKARREAERRAREAERELRYQERKRAQKQKEDEEKGRLARHAKNAANTREKREYYKTAREILSASFQAYACINADVTVTAVSNYNFIPEPVAIPASFTGLKSVVCTNDGIVGLKYDGTCVYEIDSKYSSSQLSDVTKWTHIVSLFAGEHYVVGLRDDGTCAATSIKPNAAYREYGKTNVGDWKNITAIVCCSFCTLGLRENGTVVFAGDDSYAGDIKRAVAQWKDIELLAGGSDGVIAMTSRGEFLTAGRINATGMLAAENVTQLVVAQNVAYALQADGNVFGGVPYKYDDDKTVLAANGVISMAPGIGVLLLKSDGSLHRLEVGLHAKTTDMNCSLFQDYEERRRACTQVEQAARQEAAYKAANLCRHCGGTFKKSLFSTKCSQCGKPKDY